MSKVAQGNLSDKKCEEMIKNLDKIAENIMKLKPEKKKQLGKKWWEKIKQLPTVSELTNDQGNGPMGPKEQFALGNNGPMGPDEPMWQNCPMDPNGPMGPNRPMGPNGPMGPRPHGNYNPDQNNFIEDFGPDYFSNNLHCENVPIPPRGNVEACDILARGANGENFDHGDFSGAGGWSMNSGPSMGPMRPMGPNGPMGPKNPMGQDSPIKIGG